MLQHGALGGTKLVAVLAYDADLLADFTRHPGICGCTQTKFGGDFSSIRER